LGGSSSVDGRNPRERSWYACYKLRSAGEGEEGSARCGGRRDEGSPGGATGRGLPAGGRQGRGARDRAGKRPGAHDGGTGPGSPPLQGYRAFSGVAAPGTNHKGCPGRAGVGGGIWAPRRPSGPGWGSPRPTRHNGGPSRLHELGRGHSIGPARRDAAGARGLGGLHAGPKLREGAHRLVVEEVWSLGAFCVPRGIRI